MTVPYRFDTSQIGALTKALGQSSPNLRKQLPARMRKVGLAAQRRAQQNFAWSSRIPGAIRLGSQTRGARAGVFLRIDSRKAPHARAFEGLVKGRGVRATFRHPVFGSRTSWVQERTRPGLVPAVQAQRAQVTADLTRLLDHVAAQAGFRAL